MPESLPSASLLTQVINHATEQQAQIMCTLTQLGIEPMSLDSWSYFDERDAERYLLFMKHTLAVADFRLALQQACLENRVTLDEWTGEAILRREPVKVEVTLEYRQPMRVSLIPDAFCKLVLPSGHTAWLFLGIDRGTVTMEPSHWQSRSWRR